MANTVRPCLGPFQDAVVADALKEIEAAIGKVAAWHRVDETDLRAWLAWSALRTPIPEGREVLP